MKDSLELIKSARAYLTAQIATAYDNDELEVQEILCNARSAIDYATDALEGL